MTGLDHILDRTVTIAARRETVFRYFTDSARFAAWWGAGSRIDPKPGGTVHIRYPNAVVAGGEVVEITPVERVVFTYGFESGQPIPIGASRVTITLEETALGTVVRLHHALPTAAARDEHVQGWRYQLAVFANVVAAEAHAAVGALADRFFALWGETDATRRRAELEALAVDTLAFRDPYSCTDGLDDLERAHRRRPEVHAGRRPRPRGRGPPVPGPGDRGLERRRARTATPMAKGSNVFELAPDGRIARVTGIWGERERPRPCASSWRAWRRCGVAAAAVPGRGATPPTAGGSRAASASGTRGARVPAAADRSGRPTGWLERQLRIQRDGLTGHLDLFWPDVGQSQWFGGEAEGWERAPYWLDGAIPLAFILDDAPLKARIAGYVDHIAAHQRADGWYAPCPADAATKRYDLWAILLVNKALVQYHEATGDARVLEAVVRSLRALATGLDRTPLYEWGRFRWYEGLVSTFYVYERTREPWLLDLARKLRAQGVDFEALYRTEDIAVPTPRRGLWKWTKHVVNTAMATKAAALSWRLDQRPADRAFATRMLEILDRHHGQVTGVFSGDECLAGRNPLQGTELCSVVELLYSLEHLFSVFGDPLFADRLERVAWNALPATFAPDMWSHQYDQQVNQVQCTVNPEHLFTTNGPESNLYGLEPNFGCCTANMHQGWPKLAAHLWMRTRDEGLVAAAWAPGRVAMASHGVPVDGRGRDRLPVPRDARDPGPSGAARPLPARPARAGVGGRRDVEPRRRRPAAHEGGLAPPGRARVERRDRAGPALPDAAEGHDALRRGGRGRARPPRLRARDRGGVDADPRGRSPTGSCRTATSRCGPRPPGTTVSWWTPPGPRRPSASRSGRSASGRSRPRARG